MIELIFVIVIIGILAAVAIPKLAATRDDALDTKIRANAKTCLSDVVAVYTATGVVPSKKSKSTIKACEDMEIVGTNDDNEAEVKVYLSDDSTIYTLTATYKGSKVSF